MTPRTGYTSRPNANCASATEAAPAGYRQHSRRGGARAFTSPGLRPEQTAATGMNGKVPLNWEDRACRRSGPVRVEGTFQVKESTRRRRRGAGGRPGPGLAGRGRLTAGDDAGDRPGPRGLSAGLARWRAPRAARDPGKVIADLAAAVALGGGCLAAITVPRGQSELAGPVASGPLVNLVAGSR